MSPFEFFDLAMFAECRDDMTDEEMDQLIRAMEMTEISDTASA